MKPQRWRIPDFLDLEYFSLQDRKLAAEKGDGVLRQRDRELYLQEIEPALAGMAAERQELILRWLQVRRSGVVKVRDELLLPGQVWVGFSKLAPLLLFLVMLFSGAGAAWSALSYFGREPVNVSFFFLCFVGLQVLLLVLLLLFWLGRKLKGQGPSSAYGISLVNKVLSFLFKVWLYGPGNRRREQFTAALAAAQSRGRGYAALFFWLPFLLLQLSGMAFNLGVLGAILVKVAISDLAFGWQSTIQLSADFVASLVQWLALPWSWLLGASAYPDPAQIEGSHMILKEGIYHLKSSALASWWPFLCTAIVCYCLLPRVLLFLLALFRSRRALVRISFDRADYDQLIHRLLTPRVAGLVADQGTLSSAVTNGSITTATLFRSAGMLRSEQRATEAPLHGSAIALIPDEIFAACDARKLDFLCRQAFGYAVAARLQIDDYATASNLIAASCKGASGNCLLLLQEAWQPPIQEMLIFLRRLRKLCGSETPIIIALLGRPAAATIFTAVADTDLKIWRHIIATLADLCLQVSPLVCNDEI